MTEGTFQHHCVSGTILQIPHYLIEKLCYVSPVSSFTHKETEVLGRK